MSSNDERKDFLTEHFAYELQMLRFTYRKLQEERNQLLWNALLESFAIHARNLRDFLLNDGGKNSSSNFKAKDFDDDFQANKVGNICGPLLSRIDSQIFHMGKQRKQGNANKLNKNNDIEKIYKWVVEDLELFSKSIKERDYPTDWWTENQSDMTINIGDSSPDSSAKATFAQTAAVARQD